MHPEVKHPIPQKWTGIIVVSGCTDIGIDHDSAESKKSGSH